MPAQPAPIMKWRTEHHEVNMLAYPGSDTCPGPGGLRAAPTEPSQAAQSTLSPTPEIILPSEPVSAESPSMRRWRVLPALPPEPTADMFGLEGLEPPFLLKPMTRALDRSRLPRLWIFPGSYCLVSISWAATRTAICKTI